MEVKQITGTNLPIVNVFGINYEGGKITEYAESCPHCVGYINAQIVMDAPFHAQVADETIRAAGRSEQFMTGYNEDLLVAKLDAIFKLIKSTVSQHVNSTNQKDDILTIIQVARGRSAADTIALIIPLIVKHSLRRYQIVTGYKSKDYFTYPKERFILLNIGMFGRLNHVDVINPGDILSPVYSVDICTNPTFVTNAVDSTESTNTNHHSSTVAESSVLKYCIANKEARSHILPSTKNLLFHHPHILKSYVCDGEASDNCRNEYRFILLGIEDHMPFVTPSAYSEHEIYDLVSKAERLLGCPAVVSLN